MTIVRVSILTRAIVLSGLLGSGLSAQANEPPTAPGNLVAIAVSSTEIKLSWDASTDDRRVRNYRLSRNDGPLAITGKTSYSDIGLRPGSVYEYEVVASDGSLESQVASFTLSTPAQDPDAAVSTKPGKGGKHTKPPEEPPTEEPPTSHYGVPAGWVLKFSDEFDGSGDLDISSTDRNWRFETMSDGLHRAGNSGIDALGNPVQSWNSVRGKRWSAWYDGFNAANAYRDNGTLIMGGYNSGEIDPTRPIDYVDNGVDTRYGSSKLYSSWIDTFTRKWVGPGDLHVMDPESPGKLFKYGYFETRVDFSRMQTPGFRFSVWLMPASNDPDGQDLVVSSAYDSDGNNGVEIDFFEYEWIGADYENRINVAVLGGAAGSSATNVDTSSLSIALHEGYHTLGLLWLPDSLVWTIDGQQVKEITDIDLIPDVYSYLIVSREINSGVKNPDIDNPEPSDMLEELPYIPRDPGLYAKNIWEFRDRISTDQAIVDYIRVWQP